MSETSSWSNVKLSHKVVIQQWEKSLLKTKGNMILKPNSISVIELKNPKMLDTIILYGVNSKFQLQKGIMPLDVLHRVDHKIPREMNIQILNTSSNSMPINKITVIGTLTPATKVANIDSINWSTLDDARTKGAKQIVDLPETKELVKQLLPVIPPGINLQLEADTKDRHETVTHNADIPEKK